MKKQIFISIFSLFITSFIFAANKNIDKGHARVSGGASIADIEQSGLSVFVSPSLNYFVKDRLALGGGLTYNNSSDGDFQSISIGPEVQYFFWTDEKMASYFEAGVSYSSSKSTFSGFTSTTDYFTYNLALGLEYFITESVAFGPELFFNSAFNESSSTQIPDSLGMAFNFAIYLDFLG